jgi:regulator of nucleoside diphosphate kinase
MKKKKNIYITEPDIKRLRELIKVAREYGDGKDEFYFKELESELNRGKVVKSNSVPENVITMNSRILLTDLDDREEMVCNLVFPDEADPDRNKISILAPIGIALLGYKVGDIIELKVPAGLRRLEVKKILYQPESSKK